MILLKKVSSFFLLFTTLSLFAVDYKNMSTDELMKLRGKVAVENLEDYGSELSKRVKKMDKSDLIKYDILHLIKGRDSDSSVLCSCNATNHK